MKVVCVMCGSLIREIPPKDESLPISGMCGNCKIDAGSARRTSDPHASAGEQADRSAANPPDAPGTAPTSETERSAPAGGT